MSYAIWAAIALVCFVIPATTLTGGGKRDPEKGKLAEYARNVGLPLPEEVVDPVVARLREVTLGDYLTRGERFGLWAAPAVIVAAAVAGFFIMRLFPAELTSYRPGFCVMGAGLALVTWAVSIFSMQRVLAAPARSGSDLELAWDDAERADGLRQVANLAVAVASFSVVFWLIVIAEVLTSNGFYRDHLEFSYLITAISLMTFLPLVAFTAAGPIAAWATGSRKGYEQRQLWPEGVTAPLDAQIDDGKPINNGSPIDEGGSA